ncbi:MAG: hypothetical protein MRY32_08790 [Rickettsiales bacterium]|nr:hypothetical protein [Rickettsiales bacterium]
MGEAKYSILELLISGLGSSILGAALGFAGMWYSTRSQRNSDFHLLDKQIKTNQKQKVEEAEKKKLNFLLLLADEVDFLFSNTDASSVINKMRSHNADEVFDAIFPVNDADFRVHLLESNIDILGHLDTEFRQQIGKTFKSYKAAMSAMRMHNDYIKDFLNFSIKAHEKPTDRAKEIAEDRRRVCINYFPTLLKSFESVYDNFTKLDSFLEKELIEAP